MKQLPTNPTLTDYQEYVRAKVLERGFDKETSGEVFAMLVEEVGELAKAMRKAGGVKVDANSEHHDLSDEAGDVLFVLVDLCNGLGIDLEQAFRDKEAKNEQRTWA